MPATETPFHVAAAPAPGASTPTTRSQTSFTFRGSPTAGSKPKRSRRTSWPITATCCVVGLVDGVEEAPLDQLQVEEPGCRWETPKTWASRLAAGGDSTL